MPYDDYLSIFKAGLDVQLPASPDIPSLTRFFYATDTNILYKWNTVTKAWDSTQPKSIAVGAALSAKAIAGITYLLNTAAGSVLSLPPATGSGLTIEAVVTTTATSNAHKILTSPITDKLIGNATGQTGNAVKQFSGAVASAFHSIQMPFAGTQPSGGFEGDWFSLQDISPGVWLVQGMYQAGVTPTTPFSTATA